LLNYFNFESVFFIMFLWGKNAKFEFLYIHFYG
jgi:hypothetical protein